MKKNNVLIFTLEFPPISGGAGTYSYELSRGLVKNGLNVTVLTSSRFNKNKEEEIDSKLESEGVRIVRKNWINRLWFLYWHFILKRFIKTNDKFDLILLTDKNSHIVASKVPIELLDNFAITIHGIEIDYYYGKQRLKDRIMFSQGEIDTLFRASNKIIAVSEYLKKQLIDYNYPQNNIRVVHHGIDMDDYSNFSSLNKDKLKKEILTQHGIKRNPKVLITASRLVEGKGHDVLIKSLKKVIDKNIDIILIVAGDGAEIKTLKDLATNLNLNNHVIFTGNLVRYILLKYYAISDLFAMVSRLGETFGLVYIEAMAAGLPVLAAKNGAIDEVIVPGETGLIVDPHSVSECANALINMITDDQLYDKLRLNGKKVIEDRFNNRIMAKNTIDEII